MPCPLLHSSIRLGVFGLLIAAVVASGLATEEHAEPRNGPDWIPVGSVSPEVERRALETQARLESRSPGLQRQALGMIRSDIETYGRASMRLAATPLVVDLLGIEYRILETPQGYTVDAPTRVLALQVLADLGGEPAREQLRESVRIDDDGTVRASAAQLLAHIPGSEPDDDYHTVGETLLHAVRRGGSPEEISRLLSATQQLSERVWNPEHPAVLEALVDLAGGSYSSSIRRRAMSFLEALAAR